MPAQDSSVNTSIPFALNNRRLIKYPSPFFNLAESYIPPTVKEMFKWCRYFTYKHPLIGPVIYKLSEFPVTDLVYQTSNEDLKKTWKEILDEIMNFRQVAIGIGLDFHTYGNAFCSIYEPFVKHLLCPSCGEAYPAQSTAWDWRNYEFHIVCKKCNWAGPARVNEIKTKNKFDLNFIRWDPLNIEIEFNPLTGKSNYYYLLPNQLVNDIRMGKRTIVTTVPQSYIDAIKNEKRVKFNNTNFYHFKRETLAERDQEWGKPLVYNALTTAFYMQVLQKAQEAIATQHIIPLWVLYPQQMPGVDMPSTVPLNEWRRKVEEEIQRWRMDPNYIPIFPFPVGHEVLGGEGRGLLLSQEMQMLNQNILAALGVPQEFLYGGMSYTGTSVTLRMLENHILGHVRGLHLFLNRFVVPYIANILSIEPVPAKMVDFKMADDIQRKQIAMQLNAANKIADQTLLSAVDPLYEYKDEIEKMSEELTDKMNFQMRQNIMNADIQGMVQLTTVGYQNEATKLQMRAQMEQQSEQTKILQEMAANGDPQAQAQLAQMTGQMQPGQAQAQGGAQPGQQALDANSIIQLAAMPPEQLQAMVQQGQLDQQSAQMVQGYIDAANSYAPDQLQQMLQNGQIDEQALQIIQAIQQQMQGQQAQPQQQVDQNGNPVQPTDQSGAPAQTDAQGNPIAGSMMVEESTMTPDQEAQAANNAMPNMNSPMAKKIVAQYARSLMVVPEDSRRVLVQRMREQMPQFADLIVKTYENMRDMVAAGVPKSQIKNQQ